MVIKRNKKLKNFDKNCMQTWKKPGLLSYFSDFLTAQRVKCNSNSDNHFRHVFSVYFPYNLLLKCLYPQALFVVFITSIIDNIRFLIEVKIHIKFLLVPNIQYYGLLPPISSLLYGCICLIYIFVNTLKIGQ